MESGDKRPLVGSDIHGFHTMEDLDYGNILEEARSRWLRPNEIHAILCNQKYFTIHVRPMNLPKSGTIVLFDRKMLRNFRKDGHNWKKKNDGKTVKEAHEHLKVGNEERIHVYYAHGQDSPTFVRRCYWLLDKSLEHIVLVHYRETQESQGSPVTPLNSNSGSVSDQSVPWHISEELDSGTGYYAKQKELLGSGNTLNISNHEMRLHEINTLEWDDLVTNDLNNSTVTKGDKVFADQQNQIPENGSLYYGSTLPPHNLSVETSSLGNLTEPVVRIDNTYSSTPNSVYNQASGFPVNSSAQQNSTSVLGAGVSLDILANDGLQSQDSFGRWMNYIIADSPSSVEDVIESSISSGCDSFTSSEIDQHQSPAQEQIFFITDVSPVWAFSTETTKVLITGYFHDQYLQLAKSNLICICGDASIPVECVQAGVYRCFLSPHIPGLVSLCLSLDGHNPISQILNFEYRSPSLPEPVVSSENKSNWEEFQLQLRLAHLLFSTSKSLDIFSNKVSPANLRDAKKLSKKVSGISNSWIYLTKLIEDKRISVTQAKDGLFEITLKNLLKEWLLERVVKGCKSTEHDAQGQGVIHLCAILGYSWAIYLFSWSGLSLDFRDKHGWTALHWAAYHGREKMVAVLLSAGAKPNLVTDPTTDNPGGCTCADLASMNGFDGLAAYLSEKALVAHFRDMSIAGNAIGSLQTATEALNSENLTEDELYLKDTLAAYRTAADAAARIQFAFREHSLKVHSKSVQASNPEDEARSIIAAMKIQHAFRDYDRRKKMGAAVRIQYRFRTWKMRQDFLNMRRHAIKIQAAFRGFQARKQYQKIVWSVGVLEKAILRWRLKRKGFRGLQVDPIETVVEQEAIDEEEDFYKASQKQAEERVVRSVTRVQALFRSKKAQAEYQRMKLAHMQASLEYEGLNEIDSYMDS